ncbi:hypothetical protein DFS33DRAFT_1252288 [Desarmillaria ectypa]|nr:hypothetical protein DFS33DRAFT_1252288 [Desarmillaria ectypa]
MTLLVLLTAAFAVYCPGSLLWKILTHRLLQKQTCVLDFRQLGSSGNDGQNIHRTTIICSGSFSGMFAARVCHDHFDEVVIIELEAWADDPDAKRQDACNQANPRSRVMRLQLLTRMLTLVIYGVRRGEDDQRSRLTSIIGCSPDMMTAGRPGLKTLMHCLVLGGRYKNIRQLIGIMTGIFRDASNPECLDHVTTRTMGGTKKLKRQWLLNLDCTRPASAGLKWLKRERYGWSDAFLRGQVPLEIIKVTHDQKIPNSTSRVYVPLDLGNRLPGLPASYEKCGVIYICVTSSSLSTIQLSSIDSKETYLLYMHPPDGKRTLFRILFIELRLVNSEKHETAPVSFDK